jgi:hypothetical protein
MQLRRSVRVLLFIRIPMLLRRRPFLALALSTALSCFATAALAQAPAPADNKPAIARFFEHPAFNKVMLSPSARYLAVGSSAADRHDFLVVIELATSKPTVVASFTDADVGDFQWVNDERLIFNVTEKDTGQGDVTHAPGLYAVDRNGEHDMQLADRGKARVSRPDTIGKIPMQPRNTFMLHQRARASDITYVTRPVFDTGGEHRYTDLVRLNTRTGQAQTVPRPAAVTSWWLDHEGEPRLAADGPPANGALQGARRHGDSRPADPAP